MAKRKRGRGEGGVELLPSGRWRGVVCRVVEGKRVRASKTFDSKPEALAWVAAQQVKADAPAVGTLGEWIDLWLEQVKANAAPSNHRTTKQVVDKHIRPKLGATRLRDLDRRVVADFLRGKIHNVGRVLRKLLNAAVTAGRLSASPMAGVKLPRRKDAEARPLTPAQLLEVFAVADKGGRGAMVRVWVDCALRPAELIGLQWRDYDPARGTLFVRRSVCTYTGTLRSTKTRTGRRNLPLSAPVRAALEAMRAGRSVDGDETPIFPNSQNQHYRYRNFNRWVWHPLKAALPDHLRWMIPYTFRHTCASLLLSAGGISIKTVAERLGHANPTLTLTTYAHVMPGDQERAAEAVGRLLPTVLPTADEKTQETRGNDDEGTSL